MKTKIKNNILAGLLFVLLLMGCRKDLGNYEYREINELEIGSINDSYEVALGSSPNIVPELLFSKAGEHKDENYTYEWISHNPKVTPEISKKVIHQERNLDVVPELGVGDYIVYYKVTEKSTGISWQRRFTLKIFGEYKKSGWFILNDIEGQARLDYYEDNSANWHSYPKIYRDITNLILDPLTARPMKLIGKPKFLASFTNRVQGIPTASASANKYFVYIGTEGSTEKINITDGFIWKEAGYAFVNETSSGNPTVVDHIFPVGAAMAFAVANGNLYSTFYTGRVYYGVPLNQLTTGETFPISSHIAIPYSMTTLMFDTKNKRFLRSSGEYNRYASVLPAGNFDPNGLNKDLVWMGYTSAFTGQAVAILKDGGQRIYLARMGLTTAGAFSAIALEDVTDRLTGIKDADHFTMEEQYGYFFYSVGSKIYQYDMDTKQVKMVKDYGSRKVSMLKTNRTMSRITTTNEARYTSPKYAVIVGTYDEASPNDSGTLDFLRIPGLMGSISTYYSFDGLGKVIDITYSETQ